MVYTLAICLSFCEGPVRTQVVHVRVVVQCQALWVAVFGVDRVGCVPLLPGFLIVVYTIALCLSFCEGTVRTPAVHILAFLRYQGPSDVFVRYPL